MESNAQCVGIGPIFFTRVITHTHTLRSPLSLSPTKYPMQQELQDIKDQVKSLEILITEKFLHLENMLEHRFGHFEESNLHHVNESLQRMNRHIDFIHHTYATFQTPLSYVKHKVERLMDYEAFFGAILPPPAEDAPPEPTPPGKPTDPENHSHQHQHQEPKQDTSQRNWFADSYFVPTFRN